MAGIIFPGNLLKWAIQNAFDLKYWKIRTEKKTVL